MYVLEPITEHSLNADYFRSDGWEVRQRDYGTPIYHEMFTLYGTDGLPLLEVRRNPKSAAGTVSKGVLDPRSSHIRLCNRTCYMEQAAGIMQQFIDRYHYQLGRICRIDICLDFEKFDSGDDPQKFLNRYINGKYSKLNQSAISLHGLDCWDGRYWNSVKWGSPKSMVTTKFYDKTKELQEQSDKPYIRQAWFECGLVSDWRTLEKTKQDGTTYKPRIWRVEFSIKSSEKNWFVIENPYNNKPRLRSIRHTLDRYLTRSQMLDVFFSLANHYFHFKKVVYIDNGTNPADRQLQRKDRCPDKMLWDTKAVAVFYKLANVVSSEKKNNKAERLLKYLYEYQSQTISPAIQKALYTIIEHLERTTHTEECVGGITEHYAQMLQLLIQRRMQARGVTLDEDIKIINRFIQSEPALF